jgi:hypothetical protein
MASMYGGQAAAGAVGGFKEGFDFINKAEQASQEAKMREERIKKAAMENKLLNVAFDDAMGGPSQEAQELEMLKTQVAEQTKTIQANNSTAMRKDINEAVLPTNGRDRSKMVETLKSRFKTNPDIYKSLGIQNAQTMSILNPRDQKDRTWITNTLGRAGVTPEAQGLDPNSPEWQSIIDDAIDGYPAMKADGAIVDLVGLSVATGSSAMANPEFNKRMEDNLTELWGRLDRSADNAEAVLSTEPGEPAPSLEAVEQKEMVSPTTGADIGMQGEKTDTTMAEPIADDIIAKETEVKTERAKARQNIKEVIGGIESGGAYDTPPNKNGYEGKYQFRYRDENDAGTAIAKKLGYTPEEIRNDPKKQEEVMDEYMDMNASSLEKKGHEATPYNLWLAHNQGVGGANAIINGKLTDTVRKNIKNQGVEGKTDEELIANYHAKFAPKMGEEPSAKEAQVSSTITSEISKQGKDQPLNDMRMRKVYALLGRAYPTDPNKPTAKMKEFEYLRGIVGEDKAYQALFGTSTARKSQLGKLYDELDSAKVLGDTEKIANIEQMITNTIESKGATKTKVQYDRARETNKELDKLDSLTPEQQSDYDSNLETIQSYEKTTGEQNIEAKLALGTRAYDLASQHTNAVEEAISGKGGLLDAKAEGDLKEAQRLMEQSEGEKVKSRDSKVIESMQANQLGANEVASALNRFESGDFANVEQGVIDNTLQYVETKLPDVAITDDRKRTIEANIRKNTALGFLQATLIKAMSGTAASDAEVQRLTKVMQGNAWDQPEALKVALKEFYDVLERQQGTYRGQLRVSPYDGYKLSILDKIGEGVTPKGAIPTKGDTYEGQRVVGVNNETGEFMLADGTVVGGK